jgi:dCMP deaminase
VGRRDWWDARVFSGREQADEKDFVMSVIFGSDTTPIEQRPPWDDYFFEIADTVSKRATCDRGKSGCVVVKNRRILVTGFVGSPCGFPHCDDVGHQTKRLIHEDGRVTEHCMRTIPAEQNAICQAARQGISVEGATLYTRMTPCRTCAMLVINCGIRRVLCERKYHAGDESEAMFRDVGIELTYKFSEVLQY